MTMTLPPGRTLAEVVGAGNRSCPRCRGQLRRWGRARSRVVRGPEGEHRFHPERVRCRACGVTQVVLPADVLVRRRDATVVVGQAWRAAAAGAGARRVARLVDVPMETARGWLRRLRSRADGMDGEGSLLPLQRSLAAVVNEAARAGWHDEDDIWLFVAFRSQGRLLSNTS